MSWHPTPAGPPDWYCTLCELAIPATLKPSHLAEHKLEHEMMGLSPSPEPPDMSWTCEACNETVNIFCREDHLHSPAHQRQVLRVPRTATAKKDMAKHPFRWVCTVCNESMNFFYRDDHLAGREHAMMMRKLSKEGEGEGEGEEEEEEEEEEDEEEGEEEEEDEEEEEEEEQEQGTASVSEDEGSEDHFVERASPPSVPSNRPSIYTEPDGPLSAPDDTPVTTTPGTLCCTVCNDVFPSKSRHIRLAGAHLCSLCESWIHADCRTSHRPTRTSTTSATVERFYCLVCQRSCLAEFSDVHSSEEWECTVCDRTMHLATKDAHLHGIKHRMKEREVNATPGEEPAPFSHPVETFHCAVCAKIIPVLYLDDHVSPAWECTVCERTMHAAVQDAHLKGATHRGVEDLRKQLAIADESTEDDESNEFDEEGAEMFYCPICKKDCPVKFLDAHITPAWECTICERTMHVVVKERHLIGGQHRGMQIRKQRFAQVDVEGGKAEVEEKGRFFCGVCQKSCPVEFSDAHESEAWRCEVCDRTMHVARKEEHLLGGQHRGMELSLRLGGVHAPRWNETGDKPTGTSAYAGSRQVHTNFRATTRVTINPSANNETASNPQQPTQMFFCPVCAKDYSLDYLDTHISPAWECLVCGRTMHLAVKEAHLQGMPHLQKERSAARAAVVSGVEGADLHRYGARSEPRSAGSATDSETHSIQRWQCTVCDSTMQATQREVHLMGARHKEQVLQHRRAAQGSSATAPVLKVERPVAAANRPDPKQYIETGPTHTPAKWTCTVCDSTMQAVQREVHLKGNRHKMQQEQCAQGGDQDVKGASVQRVERIVAVERPTARRPSATGSAILLPMWQCTVCETTMQATQREIHLKGNRHKLTEQQQLAELGSGAGAIAPQVPRGASIGPSSELHSRTRSAPITSKWTCPVCETTMLAFQREIHLKGNRHKTQEQLHANGIAKTSTVGVAAVKEEQLVSVDDRPTGSAGTQLRWECTLCDRTMYASQREPHLTGSAHKQKLQQQNDDGREQGSGAVTDSDQYGDKPVSIDDRQTESGYIRLRWECTVCEITMQAIQREVHLNGSRHRMQEQLKQSHEGRRQNSGTPTSKGNLGTESNDTKTADFSINGDET